MRSQEQQAVKLLTETIIPQLGDIVRQQTRLRWMVIEMMHVIDRHITRQADLIERMLNEQASTLAGGEETVGRPPCN